MRVLGRGSVDSLADSLQATDELHDGAPTHEAP